MLTHKDISDLNRRMNEHETLDNDTAFVIVTAKELQQLLQYVNRWYKIKAFVTSCFGFEAVEVVEKEMCRLEKLD